MVIGIFPADRLHEGVDVACGFGAEVDVVGMLVHIERQDRRAARERVAMVRRPLVDELAVARRPRQQHPAGAAAERLAHGDELGPPALERAEIAREGVAQSWAWF